MAHRPQAHPNLRPPAADQSPDDFDRTNAGLTDAETEQEQGPTPEGGDAAAATGQDAGSQDAAAATGQDAGSQDAATVDQPGAVGVEGQAIDAGGDESQATPDPAA